MIFAYYLQYCLKQLITYLYLHIHSLVTYLLFLSEQGNGEFTYCVKRGRGPNSSPLMKRGNRGRESNFYLMRNGTTFFKRKTFYCCFYDYHAYWFDFLNQPLFSSLCQLFSIGIAWNHLMSYIAIETACGQKSSQTFDGNILPK